jgi:hypothetical protein
MRRFRSWTLFVLAAGSFLLLIPTTALLIRSFKLTDDVQILRENPVNPTTDYMDIYRFSAGLGAISFERGRMQQKFNNATAAAQFHKQSGFVYDNKYHVIWCPFFRPMHGGVIRSPNSHRFLGFHWRAVGHDVNDPFGGGFDITVPLAALMILFGFLPFVLIRKWIASRVRFQGGRCSICGYDLRASPDRCPECGTAVPSVAQS